MKKKLKLLILFTIILTLIVFLVIYNINLNLSKKEVLNEKEELEKAEKIKEKNRNEKLIEIVLYDQGKEIEMAQEKKNEYNYLINNSDLFKHMVSLYMGKENSVENKVISDEFKLLFISYYAFFHDRENFNKNCINIEQLDEEVPLVVRYDYLNDLTKEIFIEGLNKNKIGAFVDEHYIQISIPTGTPMELYRFKYIKYNEEKDIYNFYYDEINENSEKYINIKNDVNFKYTQSDVKASYRIIYKKFGQKYKIITVKRIFD